MTFKEKVGQLLNEKVHVRVKVFHEAFTNYKGVITAIGEDYVELMMGGRG